MSAPTSIRPFDQTRAHRVVLCGAMLALGLVLWALICLLPVMQWNSARLAPSFALSRGLPIYALRDSGAHLGWFYGPVFPLWYLPVTVFSNPTHALVASGFLNLVTWLLPVAAVLRAAGASLRTAAAGTVLGAIFMLGNPLMETAFSFVHVDGVCIALQLAACLGLLHATRHATRRGLHVAALGLIAAFWTKQLALALAPALLCWLWHEKRRDLIPPLLFWCAVYGGMFSALVLAAFGPAEVLFNAWLIHSRNQWKLDGLMAFAGALRQLTVSMLPWWPAGLLAFWLHRTSEPAQAAAVPADPARPAVRLLLWSALWLTPIGLTAVLKSGGGLNSVHSIQYLMLAGLIVLVRQLGRPTRRWVVATALFAFSLGLQLVGIGKLAVASLAVRPLPDRCQEELLELARQHPGRCYFPWNPMITIITERRISPFDDALYCLWVAQLEPPAEKIRAAVPDNPIIIYLEPAQSRFAMRYFRPENLGVPAPQLTPAKDQP